MKTKWILGLLLSVLSCGAAAHSFGDSYLKMSSDDRSLQSEWQISLQDLELAVGLDNNQDGQITWGEVKSASDRIESFAFEHINYRVAGTNCLHHSASLLVDSRDDLVYGVLRFSSECAERAQQILVTYDPMFDRDPQHRGFVRWSEMDGPPIMLRQGATQFVLDPSTSHLSTAWSYLKEGVWHIWSGIDHLLFLLTLLLGVVRSTSSTDPARGWWRDIVKIVTAFTVSHSITLILGSFGLISVPAVIVEILIAGSIAVAAAANFVTWLEKWRATLAFSFGLIHGLGFAGVLEDLNLSNSAFATALVSFNIGVEMGQLVVVGGFIALVLAAHATLRSKPIAAFSQTGSALLFFIGLGWALTRAV